MQLGNFYRVLEEVFISFTMVSNINRGVNYNFILSAKCIRASLKELMEENYRESNRR